VVNGPALTLEEFAALAAQIDAGVPRDQALDDAGVALEEWSAAQALWLERMAERVASGRFTLSSRYAELFEKHRRLAGQRKYRDRRPLEGPWPLPPAPVAPPVIVRDRLVRGATPLVGHTSTQPRAHPFSQPPSQPAPRPFVRADPIPTTTLSVQEFAMLRAELAVAPEAEHPPIRERYSLDEASWLREEAAWHHRLTADDRLREQYIAHFRYMRGLLGTSGPAP